MSLKVLKKGFTIVELVIVIAVIAILAAVLIPTFSNLVEKANQSADIQAVNQMNKELAIAEVDMDIDTIGDAINALKEVNINMENYTPLTSNTQFYWVKSENRVIFVDLDDNSIIYPDQYKTLTKTNGNWYSLNGKIEYKEYTSNITTEADGTKTVSISQPEEFAKFVNDYNEGNTNAKSVKEIKLSQDIDLTGAALKFTLSPDIDTSGSGFWNKGLAGVNQKPLYLTIDGNGHSMYGFRDDSEEFVLSNGVSYGYGLFSSLGYWDNVTIKNITFSDMHIEDTQEDDSRILSFITGYLYGNLTLENVKFIDCSIAGYAHIGAIVGQNYGNLKVKNVSFENTHISGTWGVAKIVGETMDYSNITFEGNNNFGGITVSDRFGSGKIKKNEISGCTLNGDTNNTFIEYIYENCKYIQPCVTNDWTWYDRTTEDVPATYNNMDYLLDYYVNSVSNKNIINGYPDN